jgi:hypothetical protein
MDPSVMTYEPIPLESKKMLARITRSWTSAMLVGNRAPAVEAVWQRHKNPKPGDWVVETSTLYGLVSSDRYDESLWDGQFTRYLRSEVVEHQYEDGETWSEEVHICENPDGTEFRWTNATLAVVPLHDVWRMADLV